MYPPSAADTENAETRSIHTGILQQNVGSATNILYTVGGFVCVARFTFAGTLISGIESKANVALFSHALAVKSRYLLFHAAIGVCDNKGRITFYRVVSCGGIDIGGNFQPIQIVGNGMDIYFACCISGESIGIDQSPRVGVVALDILCLRKRFALCVCRSVQDACNYVQGDNTYLFHRFICF